jgi:glycine hydroxymethyltransferase
MLMGLSKHAKPINKTVFPGLQGGPHMHTIAAKAVAFQEALQPSFKAYAQAIIDNARALGATLESQGLRIVSGGTDSHLLLLDLRSLKLTGKEVSEALDKVGITVNKNTIPFDPQPPAICSGVRLGTPALTTRGMGVEQMRNIGSIIVKTIEARTDENRIAKLRQEVIDLSSRFPLYRYRLMK